MNGVILKIYYLLVVFSGATLLHAQSMDSLLLMVSNENLELKALGQEFEAALQKAPQVSQLADPELGAGAFIIPVETRVGAQRARLSASQMFPWVGTLKAREKLALAKARPLLQEMAIQKLQVAYIFKLMYLELYEQRQSQVILQRNIDLLYSLRQTILTNVEVDMASTSDVLRLDLKIRELEQEIQILQRQEAVPLAKLNQLINRKVHEPIDLPDSLTFAVLPYNRDTLLAFIQKYHPLMQQYDLQQEASRSAIELNELESMPSFGVGIDYIFLEPRSDADPVGNGRNIFQIKGTINIPLARKQYKAKNSEENLRIAAIEDRKENARTSFFAALVKAYADHETTQLKRDLYKDQIATTRAALQVLLEAYSTSGQRFNDLLQLEIDLVNYDLKLLQTLIESQKIKAKVEALMDY